MDNNSTNKITNNYTNNETLSNGDTFIAVYNYALKKADSKLFITFLMGIASGVFVGLGYIAALHATRGWGTLLPIGLKSLIFGIVFTLAINMIIFMGGELFTSNSLMFLPACRGDLKFSRLFNNLFIVLIGNFLGCVLLACLTVLSGFLDDSLFVENVKVIFIHKATMPWWQAFFSGILCNILVAGSVYISFSTKSSTAKMLLITLVITAFALSGFSHVVANIYIWALGPFLILYNQADDVTWKQVLELGYQNQIPTLLGNFIGGGILLFGLYYLIFNQALPKKIRL